jgi:hypothetical protein
MNTVKEKSSCVDGMGVSQSENLRRVKGGSCRFTSIGTGPTDFNVRTSRVSVCLPALSSFTSGLKQHERNSGQVSGHYLLVTAYWSQL